MIQAAVYGSNVPWGKSDSEDVVRAVVQAAKEVAAGGHSPRLWVLSGQVSNQTYTRKTFDSPT